MKAGNPRFSKQAMTDNTEFYVEPECCLQCGVPEYIAPEIFGSDERHCFFKRQPCSPAEIDKTVRAMWSSEVDCIRYGGRNTTLLERLARAGMSGQADHPMRQSVPAALRDQVRFRVAASVDLASASQIASTFRTDMRASGKRVLPALFGRRSVWVSWYENRFHLVRFADTNEGRFIAHLRSPTALQGLAWLLDDWLREKSAEHVQWQAAGDPTSIGPTPM